MHLKFTPSLRAFTAFILLIFQWNSKTLAQTQVLKMEVPVAAGTMYLYSDSYTGAGNCKNSLEYLPNGFNFNDPTKKYPLILFFPGLGEQWSPTDGNMTEITNVSQYVRGSSTNPSIVKVLTHGIPNLILNNNITLSYTVGSTNYEFIVLALQCNQAKPLATIEDYEKFIGAYFFEKYRDKIDFSRVYITGLSLGGGKAMEYMASAGRTLDIAAVASVAMGSECPYTPTYTLDPVYDPTLAQANCVDTTGYHNIVTNFVLRPLTGVAYYHYQADENQPVSIPQKFAAAINTRTASTTRALGRFPPGGSHPLTFPEAYNNASTEFNGSNMYRWFLNFQNAAAPLLPIHLISFTASLNDNSKVLLKWTTASESNTSHFEIERSSDGKEFKTIDKLGAAGNSSTARSYSFTDNDPGSSTVYYRLKSVDKDAKFNYSEIKKISFANRGLSFSTAPNPFRSDLTFTIEGNSRATLIVAVLDQAGRTIKQLSIVKNAGRLTQKLDLSALPAGFYMLSIKGDNINYTERLIKQ